MSSEKVEERLAKLEQKLAGANRRLLVGMVLTALVCTAGLAVIGAAAPGQVVVTKHPFVKVTMGGRVQWVNLDYVREIMRDGQSTMLFFPEYCYKDSVRMDVDETPEKILSRTD